MNLFHILVIKISHIVAAVLVFVGLQTAPVSQTSMVDIAPETGQVSVTAASTVLDGNVKVPSGTVAQNGQGQVIQPSVAPATSAPPAVPASIAHQQVVVPIYIIQPATLMTNQTPAPEAAAPAPSYTAEIISPMPAHGLGREFIANDFAFNPDGTLSKGMDPVDANSMDIGIVIRDQNGNAIKDQFVSVSATDSTQNKIIKGTGDVIKVYVDGNPQTVPCYAFHYDFKTTGDHTITFTADSGAKASVTVTAK